MKLINYFMTNEDRPMIHKPLMYFDTYEKYFSGYIGKKCKILEIGVENGGSLLMWKQYFGSQCEVVGIDIDPRCKEFESPGISIYTGDQMSESFLRKVIDKEGTFDIIIDDGGHQSIQQIRSFLFLYTRIAKDGIYLIEDIGTSYMKEYGGGYKHPNSFIEYSKSMIDLINLKELPSEIAEITRGVYFHPGIVVFERGFVESWATLEIGVKRI